MGAVLAQGQCAAVGCARREAALGRAALERGARRLDAGLPVFNILHGLRDVLQLARAGCGVFQIAVADQEQLAAQVLIGGAEAFELGLLSFDAAAQLIALRREAMDRRRSVENSVFEVLV